MYSPYMLEAVQTVQTPHILHEVCTEVVVVQVDHSLTLLVSHEGTMKLSMSTR